MYSTDKLRRTSSAAEHNENMHGPQHEYVRGTKTCDKLHAVSCSYEAQINCHYSQPIPLSKQPPQWCKCRDKAVCAECKKNRVVASRNRCVPATRKKKKHVFTCICSSVQAEQRAYRLRVVQENSNIPISEATCSGVHVKLLKRKFSSLQRNA